MSGSGVVVPPLAGLNGKLSTASVRPTVYRSEATEGPWEAISGAW